MKKLLISFLLGLTVFFSFAPYLSPAKAQATWYNQTFQEWYGKVYDPANPSEIFGERYTAAQVQWIIYGLFGFLINTVTGPTNAGIIQCFISNTADITTCVGQLTALLATTNAQNQMTATVNTVSKQSLLSLVFASNRPISGISYVKERFRKLSPVSIVHAQTPGTGFAALQPVQDFWKAFRDVSFGLFVIVAVVFAFMIMFRVKLSPQTVVSVQSALPKIVVSLILVTFSYAIAGFLIDLMYVVIGIVSLIGSRLFPGLTLAPTAWFNFLTLGQPVGLNIQGGVFLLLGIYIVLFFISLIILLFINVGAITSLLAGAITIAVSVVVAPIGIILLILALLLTIIAIIVVLWIAIKIVWGLVKAFANILLLTIFAPIQLTLGTVVPNLGFGSWVKSYVSNLAVFVVTGAMFMLCYVFLAQGLYSGFAGYGNPWGPIVTLLFGSVVGQTITGNAAWPPLLGMGGGAGVGLLFVVASFVIFTLIPKANQMIQSFMTGKPFAYGSGIGEAFGGVGFAYGASGAKETVGMAQKAYRQGQLEHYISRTDGSSPGLIGRTVDRLKNAPVIGGVVSNVEQRIGEGLRRH